MSEHVEEPLASSVADFANPGLQVRIVGDGTPEGTKVLVVDAGNRELAGVERIEFAVAVGQQPIRARITLSAVEVDMTAQADVVPAEVRG